MSARTIEVEVEGTVHEVVVAPAADGAGLQVTHGGRTLTGDARLTGTDAVTFVDGESRSQTARVVPTGMPGVVDVHLDNTVVRVTLDRQRRWTGDDADSAAGGAQEVAAPMPGKVVRVLVQADDEVEAGQGVVVVEAMKMENELRASRAGTVREVRVAEGDSVEAGRVLAIIE